MNEQTPTPAAPAQPAPTPSPAPTTQTAVHAAVASNDTAAYRAARRAERAGKPMPEVTPAPAPAATTTAPAGDVTADPAAPAQPVVEPVKQPTRKEREQAETNERVRRAIAAGVQAELDRRGLSATPPAKPEPVKPEPKARFKPLAEWTTENPEGSLEDYMDARDEWRDSQRQAAGQEQTIGEALEADASRVIESFDARVIEAEKTSPNIRAKITPLAQALGARGGPFSVVARVAAVADKGPQVLEHLADHPEVLKALVTLPERLRGLPTRLQVEQHKQHIAREIGRLEGKFDAPSAPAQPEPVQPKTLTEAPEPAQTLGTRPAEAADPRASAIRKGDTRAYRQLRRAERAAGKR